MSIEKVRADIDATDNSHNAGCHSGDCSCGLLVILRALLDDAEERGKEYESPRAKARRLVRRYGENDAGKVGSGRQREHEGDMGERTAK